MPYSGNFNVFVEFLRQKYEEFEELSARRSHLNWKGDETSISLNDTDVGRSSLYNSRFIF